MSIVFLILLGWEGKFYVVFIVYLVLDGFLDVEEIIVGLKFSGERVGQLYPVLLDKHGNLIDGLHRLKAGAKLARKISEVTGMTSDGL